MKKTFGALLLIALIIVSCKSISGIAFKIDEDNCISCGECMNVCHHNAIVYDGDSYTWSFEASDVERLAIFD